MDAGNDYHDIKEIIDIPNPFSHWFGWIVAAVTLLSLVLVIWLIRRKRKLLKMDHRGSSSGYLRMKRLCNSWMSCSGSSCRRRAR